MTFRPCTACVEHMAQHTFLLIVFQLRHPCFDSLTGIRQLRRRHSPGSLLFCFCLLLVSGFLLLAKSRNTPTHRTIVHETIPMANRPPTSRTGCAELVDVYPRRFFGTNDAICGLGLQVVFGRSAMRNECHCGSLHRLTGETHLWLVQSSLILVPSGHRRINVDRR